MRVHLKSHKSVHFFLRYHAHTSVVQLRALLIGGAVLGCSQSEQRKETERETYTQMREQPAEMERSG